MLSGLPWRRNCFALLLLAPATLIAAPSPQPRFAEPWMSGFGAWRRCTATPSPKRVIDKTDCGPVAVPPQFASIAVGECDRFMKTAMDAVRVLAYAPQCTNAAVERLAALSRTSDDTQLLSDLAGAYYVRAERKDEPADFVRALAAAQRAVARSSAIPARFNRALAEDALGLSEDAIKSWDDVRRRAEDGWRTEAAARFDALRVQQARSAAIQWPLNKQRLPLVVHGGVRAVRKLVEPYPAAAQHYVEDEVLPAWADAVTHGRGADAAAQLKLATTIARALAPITHDSYLLESVELLHSHYPVAELARAHLLFREARNDEAAIDYDAAASHYEPAEAVFKRAGSPMRLAAALGRTPALTLEVRKAQTDRALPLLRSIEREARSHGYTLLRARVYGARGYLYSVQARYLDAVAEYRHARTLFARANDDEDVSVVDTRLVGLFRVLGHEPSTWREVFSALHHAGSVSNAKSRHVLLGESAASAVALDYPEIALRYQNIAVQLLRNELFRNKDDARIASMKINLGVALRERAAIFVMLGNTPGAQADLDEALPLIGKPRESKEAASSDASITNGLRARFAEVQGETLARTDRAKAIEKLSEAIVAASSTYYHALTASLLLQRADLYLLENNRAASRADLREAVAVLRKDQQAILSGVRHVELGEALWSAHFSRSQKAYRQLIRYVIDDGGDAEAFAYAEEAHAFELLYRVLQRDDVPPSFAEKTAGNKPYGIDAIRQVLPPDTYVLEYVVLDDRTYVWLIRHDGPAERQMLLVGEREIAKWTSTLQDLASQRDVEGFEAALAAPYDALLRGSVARITALRRGAPARLVLVPDRSMHGLPFAALRNGKRYLVKDYAVSVAASATLYAYALAQNQQLSHRPLGSLLLVDDPKIDPHVELAQKLPPLHGTQKEASRIRAVYTPMLHADERKEETATIPELLRLMRGSSITHIAAHGVANSDVPSQSYLLLAPTENDSGALDAERLLRELRLNKTRLVVLSACSSAGGTPVGPEGVAPLVRPFVAAGVPGVVGTLWNIGENSATAELLVRFHRHYREGHDAADALRLAQLEMLRSGDLEWSSAIAWAPFQMVGYTSSPFPVSIH